MFHIDEEETNLFTSGKNRKDKRVAFLKDHPTLVLDTGHFGQNFVDQLLGEFDDLDAITDGVLINSENWQALSLLLERYCGTIKCVPIDPPYNTGTDEFVYRDAYQHSSWMSMMLDRARAAKSLMAPNAPLGATIDEGELARLRLLFDSVFGPENFLSNKDSILIFWRSGAVAQLREARTEKSDCIYDNPDDDPRGPWTSVSYVNPAAKAQRPNLVYPIQNPVTRVAG